MNLLLHLRKHWKIHLGLMIVLQLPLILELWIQFPSIKTNFKLSFGTLTGVWFILFSYCNLYVYTILSRKLINTIVITALFTAIFVISHSWFSTKIFDRINIEFVSKYILFLVFFLFVIGLYSMLEKFDADKRMQKLLLKNKENELKVLKSQVNPHFLMNTLNNIYATVYKKDEVSGDLILQLSGLLRYSFSAIDKEKVPLKEEIAYLEQYIELEEIRLNEAEINFYKDISDPQFLIAPLLFIPLVENAFKHGLSEDTEASWLTIDLKQNKDILNLNIRNSLPNIERKKVSQGTGITNCL